MFTAWETEGELMGEDGHQEDQLLLEWTTNLRLDQKRII